MKLILTIIIFTIFNYLTKFIIDKVKELIQIIKLKKSFKNFNLNDSKNVDKDFWEDLENEDISTDRDN